MCFLKQYLLFYLAVPGLHCSMWDLLLWCAGFSLAAVHGLDIPEPCVILVPQPGMEPTSSALEGRFLTTALPGKSLFMVLLRETTMR